MHYNQSSMHRSSISLLHRRFSARYGMFPQRHRLFSMHDRIPTNVGCKVTT